jgi:predicted DNA-binding transcriptional regulator AlpA
MTATARRLATVRADQTTAPRPESWTNSPELVHLLRSPTDTRGVTENRTSPTTTTAEPRSAVEGSVTSTRYGLPLARYERAWTVEDIQTYLHIGRTQAYALVKDDDFPPRLRTGRAHRWNGLRVMAWLHGDDWRTVELDLSSAPASPTTARRAAPSNTVPAQPASRLLASAEPARPTKAAPSAPGVRRIAAPQRPVPPVKSVPRRRVIDPSDVQHQRNKDKLAELLSRP